MDQLLEATDDEQQPERADNEAVAAKRKESVSTSWRQVMLNQSDQASRRCSVNTTQVDLADLATISGLGGPEGTQTQQVEGPSRPEEDSELEEVRSKLEDAQKRTNALIMIDCLTKKRSELRKVDEKLHRMIRECLLDFDISRAGSPISSSADHQSSLFHNQQQLVAHNAPAVDLSKLNSDNNNLSVTSWFPRSDETGTNYAPAQQTSAARSSVSSGSSLNDDEPVTTRAAPTIINLKKSRLLGAVLPPTLDKQQAAATVKRRQEELQRRAEVRLDGPVSPAFDAARVRQASPQRPLSANRYADISLQASEAGASSTAKMIMMLMMMPPTSSGDHSSRRSLEQLAASAPDESLYRHSNPLRQPEDAHNDQLRSILLSPEQVYLNGLPASQLHNGNEDEILFKPAKRLCSSVVLPQSVAEDRLKAMTSCYSSRAAEISGGKDMVDLKQLHLQQQHHRETAVSDYVERQFRAGSPPTTTQHSSSEDDQHVSLADCVDLRLRMMKRANGDCNARYYSSSILPQLPTDKTAAYIFAAMQHNKSPQYDYQHLFHQSSSQQLNMTTPQPQQLNLPRDGPAMGLMQAAALGKDAQHDDRFPLASGPSGSSHQQHMSDVQKMAFRCHVCGSGFEDRHRLQQHLSIHLNLHPSWFEEKTIKETLAQYESKRGDYFCSLCNVRFETTAEFDKHMQLHGDKPHRCELCNHDNKLVCFRYYRQLLTHLRSHCFLYSCRFVPECKQTSNRKDYLKLHILKHHLNNKLPEQYTICCH